MKFIGIWAWRAWVRDCLRWRRRVLTGKYAHWCFDWDELPIDETTPEWPCACACELRDCWAGNCKCEGA